MNDEQRDAMLLAILRCVVRPPQSHDPMTWGDPSGWKCPHCHRCAAGLDPEAIAHAADCPATLLAAARDAKEGK